MCLFGLKIITCAYVMTQIIMFGFISLLILIASCLLCSLTNNLFNLNGP